MWDYLPCKLSDFSQPASSSQPAATRQLQPASQPSQPAKPASQPTLHPGIEASGLQPAGIDVSKLLIRGIQSGGTGRHRPPQAATGRHRLPQAAKLSGTHSTRGAAKHAINPSNIDDMANGRLWDDHFRHLGHPPKFYRVQDASSGNNSPFWYYFRVICMKNHLKIIKYHVFSKK